MDKVYLQVKDVDEFFAELHHKCKQKTSYSLLEIIQEMGVTFNEVQNWVKSNENWLYIVELCLDFCFIHVQEAELVGDLSKHKVTLYLKENQSIKENLK